MMRKPIASALASFVLALGTAMPAHAAPQAHPVAAVKQPNGPVFVLTLEGTVLAVNMSLDRAQIVGRFSFPVTGYAADMAYGVVNGQQMLFIGTTSSSASGVLGSVFAFTTDGHRLGSWTLRHVIAGVAFDNASQTLYVSSGDSPELYSIAPQSKAPIQFVANVPGTTHLGSMAIDDQRQTLYLCDVDQGAIFAMQKQPRRITAIGRVTTPQALTLSPDNTAIFIADSGRKQVVSLSLGTSKMPMRNFTPPYSFKTPSGLAYIDATHLAVADQLDSSISVFDATGKKLYSLPLH